MDAANYVGQSPSGTYVVVVGGVAVAEFLDRATAERTFNLYMGTVDPVATIPVAVRPEDAGAPSQAPCGHGEPAPVVGGCWCCLGTDGQPTTGTSLWATDPRYCQPPICAACGNCPGQNTQPAPRQDAPRSPESSLPPIGAPTNQGPSAASNAPVLDVDTIAARLGVSRREVYALAAIAAAVLVLR